MRGVPVMLVMPEHAYFYDVWGNLTQRLGWGGWNASATYSYQNNRNNALQYDLSGNVTSDGSALTYDATGQQVSSVNAGQWNMGYAYDGDRLRVRKDENAQTTYYVRSSVLGGQVTAEVDASGQWVRGHVYLGSQALALQEGGSVSWVHEDPITKTKKRTNAAGTVTSSTVVDPWGGEVEGAWVQNPSQQKRKFTTYERGADNRDEAMHRGYSARLSRFDQPDPYDGSYDLTDPQSFNRYAYVNNDPVNFVDPSGLNLGSFNLGLALAGCSFVGYDRSEREMYFCWNNYDPVGGGGGGGEGGGGGGRALTEPEPELPESVCDQIRKKIDELVNRNKRTEGTGGTHGLRHRFHEQIHGRNGPGTQKWKNHETAIREQQQGLKNQLKKFMDNNCGPPPPGAREWAYAPVPRPEQWISPEAMARRINRMKYAPYELDGDAAVKAVSGAAAAGGAYVLIRTALRIGVPWTNLIPYP